MGSHRHSHIVPAGYLRAWARDGLVAVGWTDGRAVQQLPPKAIGVRSRFYREQLSDGTSSDWLDPAMGRCEDSAISVIRTIEERWPISDKPRGQLSEFLALQLVRTPAWRDWYAQALDSTSFRFKGAPGALRCVAPTGPRDTRVRPRASQHHGRQPRGHRDHVRQHVLDAAALRAPAAGYLRPSSCTCPRRHRAGAAYSPFRSPASGRSQRCASH